MNKLNKLYKLILEALGCRIKEDHQIVMVNNNKEYEVKVDGKKTYLPTNDAMNTFDKERVFFHPACESITSKETEIDKIIRKLITSSVYFNFKPIAAVLSKVANKRSNKTVAGKLLERLEPMKGIDKEVENQVIDLIARISIQTEYEGMDTRIINYTLMRGGKTENDEHIYYRCVPSFPFYNEITRTINQNSGMSDEQTVIFNDANYKLKTLKIVQSIFEIAIPLVEDPSRGEAIALNPIAARMTAMLRCFGHIAGDINNLIAKFRKEFDGIGMYGVETGWVEQLDDLPEIASMVPPLEYNNYNTAGKQQDPTQDQNNNLFNVLSDRYPTQQPQVNNYQYGNQQQPQPQKGAPNPPKAKDGETYIGMTALSNGLYEFRFQNNTLIRVVCMKEDGQIVNENFTNAQGQPYNMNGGYQNGFNGYPQGYGVMNMPQQYGNGVTQFTGGIILPNGVVVPMLTPNNMGGSDPYGIQQPEPVFNTSGMSNGNMMSGTGNNWS